MNFDEKLLFLHSGKTLQNGDLFSSTDKMPQNFLSCCPNSGKKRFIWIVIPALEQETSLNAKVASSLCFQYELICSNEKLEKSYHR